MATQNVDYAEIGATLDTGEKDAASIRPVLNGEPAIAATFQRPMENLRHRTEVLRQEVEDLKFLADADRAFVLQGGGEVTWGGSTTAGGTGVFTIGAPLVLKPFMAPAVSTPARATIRGMEFVTATTGSVVPRAYSGANKISVQLTGADGATLGLTVSGAPADNVVITINTNALNGTTPEDLYNFLSGNATFAGMGLTMTTPSGAMATQVICPDGVFVDSDTQTLSGALDAERHIIDDTRLLQFFNDPANKMQDDDVLVVAYEDGLVGPAFSGRRQSIASAPENNANVSGSLFLLRLHPDRAPYALPLATVVNGALRFVDGSIVLRDIPTPLTGGIPGLPPPTNEPPAQFLRMQPDGNHYWAPISSNLIVPNVAISGFSVTNTAIREVGEEFTPAFSATYANAGQGFAATLTRDANTAQATTISLSTPSEFTAGQAYRRTNTNDAVTFVLSATNNLSPNPVTANVTVQWQRYFYFGRVAEENPTLNVNFIKNTLESRGGKVLSASPAATFSITNAVAEYVYIAFPAINGLLSEWIDNETGLDISFVLRPAVANVTTENTTLPAPAGATYRVYRSAQRITSTSLSFTTR